MILHVIIAMVAGWINRHQQQVITYLKEKKIRCSHPNCRMAVSV